MAGLTQEKAAAQVQLSRTALAQVELGNRTVSSMELDRLAHLYGRAMRQFFGVCFTPENALAALLRANVDLADHPRAAQALRQCLALARELTNLEHLTGLNRDPPRQCITGLLPRALIRRPWPKVS